VDGLDPLDGEREERVARNEAVFRQANEDLRARIGLEQADQQLPFLCECGDDRCTTVIVVPLETYELARSEPAHFLIATGHRQLASEQVTSRGEGYEIIEKHGRAGEIARESAPERRRRDA
jgi:hypothetical protein